jgi:sporulation protein YlmC with PRC-barrel domain
MERFLIYTSLHLLFQREAEPLTDVRSRSTEVVRVDVSKSLNCRELRECDVVDSSGEKVGRISDMTFTFDGELKLSQFILAGSVWEEFLESVGVKPDVDPVFDGTLIERLGDKIELNTSRNSLKSTPDEDAVPVGEIRLSALEDMEILDTDGVVVGKAVDIDFDVNGMASLTVGGGFIEETLESLGLKEDVDIIVPGSAISAIQDNIRLSVSKESLGLNVNEALRIKEVDEVKTRYADDKGVMKVRLFHRPM